MMSYAMWSICPTPRRMIVVYRISISRFFTRYAFLTTSKKRLPVVSLADCRHVTSPKTASDAFRIARGEVDDTITRLSRALCIDPSGDAAGAIAPCEWNPELWAQQSTAPLRVDSNFTREAFCQAVRDCVEYIRAGDIFQVVPSQRLSVKTEANALEIYRSVARREPKPFHVLCPHTRMRIGGVFPGDHVPGRRSSRDGAAIGRHAETAEKPTRKTKHSNENCWPTPKNVPST